MAASAATAASTPATASATHQAAGMVNVPPPSVARTSPMPIGMPATAPDSAGSNCRHQLEAIAARHLGAEVWALSLVTNPAAGAGRCSDGGTPSRQ